MRKAAKKNIPMVCPEWLEACVANKRKVETTGYTLCYQKSSSSSGGSGGGSGEGGSDAAEERLEAKEQAAAEKDMKSVASMQHVQTFDFGCCCGCHDNVPPLATCEWCPDCYKL